MYLDKEKLYISAFFHKCSIIKVWDLILNDRAFPNSEKVYKTQLSKSQRFVMTVVVDAIPSEWRSIIKGNAFTAPSPFTKALIICQ